MYGPDRATATSSPSFPADSQGLTPAAKSAYTGAVESWVRSDATNKSATREAFGRWLYAIPRWDDSSQGYTQQGYSWAAWRTLELAYRRELAALDGKPLPTVALPKHEETWAEKAERALQKLGELLENADKVILGLAALAVVVVFARFR